MAASFYSNSVHVDFESVLAMGEPGMVSMFQALIASGLQGFLGCPVVVYEDALVEFFANGTVRDGLVVSTVNGVVVEISEKLFAETFDLPLDGLAEVSEIPKDKIFDARSIVSLTGEPVILSGSKSQMKMHYRLLCDIMAKSISVKAGSFNCDYVEKFSLLTAVVCDVRMNWGSVLFGIFKKMVTPGTKQAKGFAIQISLLLDSVPNLELGESSEFPSSKILTDKTIQRCSSADDVDFIIQKVLEETREVDAPTDRTQPPPTEERHWFDLPYEDLIEKWAAERPVVTASDTDEEDVLMDVGTAGEDQQVQEPVAQISNDDFLDADEQKSVDEILLSIPVDVPLPSAGMEITKIVMGQEIKIPGVTEKTWFLSSLPQIPVDHKGKAIFIGKDTIKGNPSQEHFFLICADIDLLVALRAKNHVLISGLMRKRWDDVCLEVAEFCAYRRLLPVGSINSCRALEIVETDSRVDFRQPTVFTLRLSQFCTVQIQYSLFSRLSTTDISDFLSSIALDRTVYVVYRDLLLNLQAILSEQIYESQSGISSKLHKIEQGFRDSLNEQAAVVKKLFQEACQEGRSMDDVQTLRFNEFRKNILAQNDSIFVGLADVRKEVQEVNAKVDIMASRLNDVQKDAEATKEALSNQLFEFQSQAQENQNILHAQLSELVDYIHRGGADKKGESGSRGPQQTSNVKIEGSAVRTPTFAQRVEMAQRHIVQTVLDADSNRELLERQAAAERDRERRRREARMLKRRRKY
ncbi:hypothetical protein F511_11900 [Dorcoceras hygrometricum]|uniref:Dystroglycan-like n=1 Tax=Dorcoceras hygrometricum TaxID=472368 RepID=A0A2Z7B034_9LAMI|nr:hypothetical protein F511_11900 [Dorcoceras hygrometricum]